MLWCKVEGCLYPYVTITQVAAITHDCLDPNVGSEIWEPVGNLGRSIRLQWGMYLTRLEVRNDRHNEREGAEEGVWGGNNLQSS